MVARVSCSWSSAFHMCPEVRIIADFSNTPADLLRDNPDPSEEEIRVGLEGNLCRCTGYHNIVRAVQTAASASAATAAGAAGGAS